MRTFVAVTILAAATTAAAESKDPWAGWAPLLGTWEAERSADSATGGFTLEKGLGGRVLLRRNRAQYPATKERPAAIHEDLMVIYPEGGATRADYFDNEGHTIHYAVRLTPASKNVVFESAATPGQPRFRLTYDFAAKDTIALEFAIAPPPTPDQFRPYITARVHRVHE